MREVSYDGFILGHTQTNQLDFDLDLKGLHYTQLRARDYGPGHLYYDTVDRANNSDGTAKFPLRFSESGTVVIDDAEAAQCVWTLPNESHVLAPYPDRPLSDEVSAKPVGVRDADILVRSNRRHGAFDTRASSDLRVDFASDMSAAVPTLAISTVSATGGGSTPGRIAFAAPHGIPYNTGVRAYLPALSIASSPAGALPNVVWLEYYSATELNVWTLALGGTKAPILFATTGVPAGSPVVTLNYGTISAFRVLGAAAGETFTDQDDRVYLGGARASNLPSVPLVNERLDVRGRARLPAAEGMRWLDVNGQAGTAVPVDPAEAAPGVSVSRADQTVDCRFELDYGIHSLNVQVGRNVLDLLRCELDLRLRCLDAFAATQPLLELRYGSQANRIRLRTHGIAGPQVALFRGFSGYGASANPDDVPANAPLGLVDGNSVEWDRDGGLAVPQRFADTTYNPAKLTALSITPSGSNPVVFAFNSAHYLPTGTRLYVSGAGGTTSIDGWRTVTRTGDKTLTLDGTPGSGTYSSAARLQPVATMGDNGLTVDGAYVWACNPLYGVYFPSGTHDYSWLFRLPGPGVYLVSVVATQGTGAGMGTMSGTWLVSTPVSSVALVGSVGGGGGGLSLLALAASSTLAGGIAPDPRDLVVSVTSATAAPSLSASAVRMQPGR